jgi:hypothetical protein
MKRRVGPDSHDSASLFAKITRLFEPLKSCSWPALPVVTLSSIPLGERNLPTMGSEDAFGSSAPHQVEPSSFDSAARHPSRHGVQVLERQNVAGQKRRRATSDADAKRTSGKPLRAA